ncbi:hypothetical protein AYO20_08107 [Fonsecaea nubica]|uniref:Zn(2)-C6 fungal-type domain-containing protein n=1 Tax=Fonsecaea nubica TaxID=856822 RepID=A0A178CR07_9EURO|nr:hypothetical protein AYO20_08107 [Fonsecaea nubica]OAL31714.1 hypothetical protein AYO20_08107 [Fonsecaea nubica]
METNSQEERLKQRRPQSAEKGQRMKRSIACDYCRAKKVRCNFENGDSCMNCIDRGLSCSRPSRPQRRKNNKIPVNPDEAASQTDWMRGMLQPFLSEYPNLVTAAGAKANALPQVNDIMVDPPGNMDSENMAGGLPGMFEVSPMGSRHSRPPPPNHDGDVDIQLQSAQGDNVEVYQKTSESQLNAHQLPGGSHSTDTATTTQSPLFVSDHHGLSAMHSPDPPHSVVSQMETEDAMGKSSIWSNKMTNYQYSGPTSFISICSTAGIQWVSERTGSATFVDSANEFTTRITRLLKIEKRCLSPPIEEPDLETALIYTTAYFEDAIDAEMAIVHRPWFEQRLSEFYNSGMKDQDASWYALRMAIFASGSQIELSKTKSFREANETGWRYFENALSVYTNILFYQTSVEGVQALVIMSYYCSTVSHPCLEYMLCNDAVRLAVAQGLHRQPPPSLKLTQSEITQRQCIFWAAYCLEKQTVSLSGRHSMIDDSDITLPLPTTVSPGSTLNLKFAVTLILVSHLSSMVSKRLTSMYALRQGLDYLVHVVSKLDEKLEALKKSLEPILSSSSMQTVPGHRPSGMSLKQILFLRYAISNVTLGIHTSLTHPWAEYLFAHQKRRAELQPQIDRSSQIVAETCRNAIRMISKIQFDASTPVSVSFFGPIYSLINLFIFILQSPSDSNAKSDVALLDFGAGHFAWMQIFTESEVSIGLAKELAVLAQGFLKKYQNVDKDSAATAAAIPMTASTPRTGINFADQERVREGGSGGGGGGGGLRSNDETDETTLTASPPPPPPDFGYQQTAQDLSAQLSEVPSSFDINLEYWSTFVPDIFDPDPLTDFAGVDGMP